MTTALVWSPPAIADIDRLHGFLKVKNPAAARRAVSAIREGVKMLAQHPDAGRPMEDMPAEFREWPIKFGASGYVVIYRTEDDKTVLLRIKHALELAYER